MKKLAYFLLCGILSVSFMSVSSFARTGNTIYYNEKSQASNVSNIPSDAFTVTAIPNSDDLSVGDKFYVDFVLKNNPGICSFVINIEYNSKIIKPIAGDSSNDNAAEIKYNNNGNYMPVIPYDAINEAIKIKNDSPLYYTNYITDGSSDVINVNGDGILLRVNFEAVGNGTSKISLTSADNMFFSKFLNDTYDTEDLPIYSTSSFITVKGSSTNNNNNNNNNNNSNNNKNNKNEPATKKTETTTKTVTEIKTETTTESKAEITTQNTDKTNTSSTLKKDFKDMWQAAWAEDAVENLCSLGILNGVSDNLFEPKANTKRADLILVISRLLEIETTSTDNFNDVNSSKYYAKALAAAKEKSIATGIGNNMFNPEGYITRQDAFVIVARAMKNAGITQNADTAVLNKFKDNSQISQYAKEAAAMLVSMEIVSGDKNGNINPKANITRAEMAVLINGVYNKIK